MPETTETFRLGDILSITTGCLVSRDHIDGVYRILNHMTGDNLSTHALPRASDACRPSLCAQHPVLAAIEAPESFDGEAAVWAWMDAMEAEYGDSFEVAPLAEGDHTVIDPISELKMLRPDMPILTVDPDGGVADV